MLDILTAALANPNVRVDAKVRTSAALAEAYPEVDNYDYNYIVVGRVVNLTGDVLVGLPNEGPLDLLMRDEIAFSPEDIINFTVTPK